MQVHLCSVSADETRSIGERIGEGLVGGDILALAGDLGAGKTTLTQGIARGLGIPETDIVSPTYTLIREAAGRVPLFHVDLYRVSDPDDLENAGFFDAFDEQSVTVIEWADRFPGLVPHPHLLVRLERKEENVRNIVLEPRGDRFRIFVDRLLGDAPARWRRQAG